VFITFEGPEGSGKSLQARLLAAHLREYGYTVVETHEPGGTALGDEVRHLLLSRDELAPVARSEALLMNASRAQLVETLIKPALARGDVVVCDRFADSTRAYQGGGRGLGLHELDLVISFATAGLEPDMTMLLDVPVEVGLARKHAQDERNRFEAEALAFHTRVRNAYQHFASNDPSGRWVVVDGSQPIEVIEERIWSTVSRRLEGRLV
jgi:dTMP kinase